MEDLNLGPRDSATNTLVAAARKMDIFNPKEWIAPTQEHDTSQPREDDSKQQYATSMNNDTAIGLFWHGAPKIAPAGLASQLFRQQVRKGLFKGPTNSQCPGFLQCNLVVLPQGPIAFDFIIFCQRNKKACPLIEVCDVGSPYPTGVARGADLRTDVPK
jgi:hypothetical protein